MSHCSKKSEPLFYFSTPSVLFLGDSEFKCKSWQNVLCPLYTNETFPSLLSHCLNSRSPGVLIFYLFIFLLLKKCCVCSNLVEAILLNLERWGGGLSGYRCVYTCACVWMHVYRIVGTTQSWLQHVTDEHIYMLECAYWQWHSKVQCSFIHGPSIV